MLDFYIGQAGIPPDQFWINTWRENALLGESYTININLHWEMHRFVSTMVVNTKATKRSQMITPDKLFPLPQDAFIDKGKPKSTPSQYQDFLNQIEKSQSKK
jgi:hypothetical protein